MQFQSQSPHCNLSHAQKKIDLYNQTKPSQDDRIPQRAQLELSGPDAEHVSLLRSSLHVTECSSGFLQADIIARQPEILTGRGSFVLMRSVIQCVALRFVTLHLSSEQSRLGCRVSEHTRPLVRSLVVLFSGRAEQNTPRHVARPCSHFHPLEFHFIVSGAFYQTGLFPINGIIQKTHLLLCLKLCLQFMSSCSYL